MATRHQVPVPQQQRGGGGGGVPKGKPKNVADGPNGKNRRALGDIGNLVTAGAAVAEAKPLPRISRPITRSFGAQLLANAQAAAAKKKPVGNAADGAGRKGPIKEDKQKAAAPKPKTVAVIEIKAVSDTDTKRQQPIFKEDKQKAAAPKPKPVAVIEINAVSDTDTKWQQPAKKKISSRKKVDTLTSVLTARSKAACGVGDKIKPSVIDIDSGDTTDQLAVVDYIEDLYKFYKHSEHSSRPHDYMDSQAEINARMRAILADWLIEVHHKFELMPESLYLTIHIIDRYLSMEKVVRKELQLVGVSAMLIACKYEEIWAPQVDDFMTISDQAYSRQQILAMEKSILNKLEWSLTVPTPYVFLVRFIKAAMCDKEMEHMVFFLAELGLMHYPMITYCPSMIAASAVYAARCTLKKTPLWTDTLKCHTGFTEHQLLDCAEALVKCHSAAPLHKLKFVYSKYSVSQLSTVALLVPATEVMEQLKAASVLR